ncbi:hypothetical protein HDK77DRAFT_180308 [Phyllosticta capitalensis]
MPICPSLLFSFVGSFLWVVLILLSPCCYAPAALLSLFNGTIRRSVIVSLLRLITDLLLALVCTTYTMPGIGIAHASPTYTSMHVQYISQHNKSQDLHASLQMCAHLARVGPSQQRPQQKRPKPNLLPVCPLISAATGTTDR